MSDFPDFKKLRFDERHHLGMGDVRITIAQQDAIDDEIERLQEVHKRDLAEYNRVAADVTRLRAALERIARDINEGPPGSNWQDGYNAAARIAREALHRD